MCWLDGQPYSVNTRVKKFFPDNVYCCFVKIPPTIPPGNLNYPENGRCFDKVVHLFQDFIVTVKGCMKAMQQDLDNCVKIENISFALMDSIYGNFNFICAHIWAVNLDKWQMRSHWQSSQKLVFARYCIIMVFHSI